MILSRKKGKDTPDRENSMGKRYKVQEFKRLKLKMGGERNLERRLEGLTESSREKLLLGQECELS